jgi:hypothetical protein
MERAIQHVRNSGGLYATVHTTEQISCGRASLLKKRRILASSFGSVTGSWPGHVFRSLHDANNRNALDAGRSVSSAQRERERSAISLAHSPPPVTPYSRGRASFPGNGQEWNALRQSLFLGGVFPPRSDRACSWLPRLRHCRQIVRGESEHAGKQWDGRPHPQTASACQSGSVIDHLTRMGASAMNITTVGIDLAKSVFQVHGVDARSLTNGNSGSTAGQNCDYTHASSGRDRVPSELRISGSHAVSADVAPVRSIAG